MKRQILQDTKKTKPLDNIRRSLLPFILLPLILFQNGCFKNEAAIRASVEQENAIKNSIVQKTTYVEYLLKYIEDQALAQEQTEFEAAVRSIVKPDGSVNLATVQALQVKRVERIKAIQAILADARAKWAACLVDDANALAFNASMAGWIRSKVEASKVLASNADSIIALLERVLAPKAKVVTP